jgi:hypothetical protein
MIRQVLRISLHERNCWIDVGFVVSEGAISARKRLDRIFWRGN